MSGAASDDGVAVLDPVALDQLRALQRPGRPSIVGRVIALFREDAPRHVDAMQSAVRTGADDELKRAAHTLKSTAANVGASALRAACAEIETGVREGRTEAARAVVERIPALLDPVLEALSRQPEAS